MKSTEIKFTAIPSTEEVKAERDRLAYRSRYGRVLRSTIYALVVVAAVAVLLATLFLPVLQVSGDSMNPTLEEVRPTPSTACSSWTATTLKAIPIPTP